MQLIGLLIKYRWLDQSDLFIWGLCIRVVRWGQPFHLCPRYPHWSLISIPSKENRRLCLSLSYCFWNCSWQRRRRRRNWCGRTVRFWQWWMQWWGCRFGARRVRVRCQHKFRHRFDRPRHISAMLNGLSIKYGWRTAQLWWYFCPIMVESWGISWSSWMCRWLCWLLALWKPWLLSWLVERMRYRRTGLNTRRVLIFECFVGVIFLHFLRVVRKHQRPISSLLSGFIENRVFGPVRGLWPIVSWPTLKPSPANRRVSQQLGHGHNRIRRLFFFQPLGDFS